MNKPYNKLRIWRMLVPGLAMAIVIMSFGAEATAESTSASYKAVDFINPQASLSNSTSYKLSDSVDYYGGVNKSTNYQECTGDFAVLSACGGTVTPPPPPPPPPPTPPTPPDIGVGGDFPQHPDCTNQINCPITPPPSPPVVVIPEVPKKPFVLPKIKEPAFVEPVVVVPEVKKVVAAEPKVSIQENIKIVEEAIIKAVLPKLACSDLQCVEGSLLRGSAKKLASGNVCKIYTFGGFALNVSCQDTLMIWLLALLFSLFVLPVRLIESTFEKKGKVAPVRKRKVSKS